jgi:hypothetical protein
MIGGLGVRCAARVLVDRADGAGTVTSALAIVGSSARNAA